MQYVYIRRDISNIMYTIDLLIFCNTIYFSRPFILKPAEMNIITEKKKKKKKKKNE